MDSNLILYDIDHFLDKYTRFMTKDIYISNKIYNCFLDQYKYLYDILEKNQFLYSDNIKYKKVLDIKKNKKRLIKLHNQKYLKKAIDKYQSFFEKNWNSDELDVKKKSIILSQEEQILVVQSKNIEILLEGKIKFLLEEFKYNSDDILVLTDSLEKKNIILNSFYKKNILVNVNSVKEYGLRLLKKEEQILDDDKKYVIFSDYLMKYLFEDKKKFEELYNAFYKYIYLNKDYKEYETFKDYHNYMYKRKFLSSNLTLKKFNECEIKKRRTYLRTIKNEVMKTKEEVDIANFLYLNSVYYQYDYDKSCFYCSLDEKNNNIKFFSGEESLEIKDNSIGFDIYLFASYKDKKTYLEVLLYELIKRRYPLELINDNVLYKLLKDTTIENYFSEFIRKYLIPTMDYYEKYGTFDNTKLNTLQQQLMIELYEYYQKRISKCNYVKESELLSRIEKDIEKKRYRYLFLAGDLSFNLKVPVFTIISDYYDVQLLRENIKLLYDYKKYLYNNQTLPIAHTYLNYEELNNLTLSFLKDNLEIINKALEENKKEIDIRCYDDKNRLRVYNNISECCKKILDDNDKSVSFAFEQLKDINILIGSSLFFKKTKNMLSTNDKKVVLCEEILKISKLYNIIVLPYLIIDDYHEDFLRKDVDYYIKLMLYVSLSKCRDKVILLCPKSRKQEVLILLKKIEKSNCNRIRLS